MLTLVAAKATNEMGGLGVEEDLRLGSILSSLNQGRVTARRHGWVIYSVSTAILRTSDLYITPGGGAAPCVSELELVVENVWSYDLLRRARARIDCW